MRKTTIAAIGCGVIALTTSLGSVQAVGDDGAHRPTCRGQKATIVVKDNGPVKGTKHRDVMVFTDQVKYGSVDGRGGNDLICGAPFASGGRGNDVFVGGREGTGGPGDDRYYGRRSGEIFYGGAG
ncbi:MAG: hypothetical protein L0K86_23145, partial [Actinomycetia bacterium]|nr:hypothetical protein [Actinomycetes bacterium]